MTLCAEIEHLGGVRRGKVRTLGASNVSIDRIGTRLHLAFAVVILFAGLAAVVESSQIHALQKIAARTGNEFWPKASIANRIIDDVNHDGRAALALMYLTDMNEVKESAAHSTEASRELSGLDAQLDAKIPDDGEKKLFQAIQKNRANYIESRKQAVDLALAGKREQAQNLWIRETIPFQKLYLQSLHRLIDMQGQAIDDSVVQINQVGKRTIFLVNLLAAISSVAAIAMAIFLGRSITRPLTRAVVIAQSVSQGSLDNEIRIDSRGETGELLSALKLMQEKLSEILRKIHDSGLNMGQSALHIATISEEVAEVNKEQEHRSGQVSAAVNEMHQISSSVQTQAVEAADRSRKVETLARNGIENLRLNIHAMDETTLEVRRAASEIQELEQSAQRINDIANTIQKIASQTNLLALNAAIEAARAGKEGRGFAVVAGAVRQLAVRTTNSAKEVSEIVEQVSGKIRQVSTTMNVVVKKVDISQEGARSTAQIIEGMASDVVITANANQGITVASHQQNEQFTHLSKSLDTLKETLNDNCLKVENTIAVGYDLRGVAKRLNHIMANFTFDTVKQIAAARDEHRGMPRAQNRLRIVVSQNGVASEALTIDFSMTGARLSTRRQLDKNLPVAMALYQPHDDAGEYQKQEPLPLTGRITWGKQDGPTFQSGVVFDEYDSAKRLQIQKCFEYFGKNHSFQPSGPSRAAAST